MPFKIATLRLTGLTLLFASIPACLVGWRPVLGSALSWGPASIEVFFDFAFFDFGIGHHVCLLFAFAPEVRFVHFETEWRRRVKCTNVGALESDQQRWLT